MPSYGSPRRLFKGKSVAQLLVLQATFEDQLVNGRFTNSSGAQKSQTVEYGIAPDHGLFEANYELQILGYIAPIPTVIYQNFAVGLQPMPSTVNSNGGVL